MLPLKHIKVCKKIIDLGTIDGFETCNMSKGPFRWYVQPLVSLVYVALGYNIQYGTITPYYPLLIESQTTSYTAQDKYYVSEIYKYFQKKRAL